MLMKMGKERGVTYNNESLKSRNTFCDQNPVKANDQLFNIKLFEFGNCISSTLHCE